MHTIEAKYMGPSETHGARIKATASGGFSLTVKKDHSLTDYANHERAAKTLVEKLNWPGQWVCGGTKTGYIFVNIIGSEGGFNHEDPQSCAHKMGRKK